MMLRAHTAAFRWLKRCQDAHSRTDQAVFPIVQGGLSVDLRKKCIAAMAQLADTGIAIGGLSGGNFFFSFCNDFKF